MSKGIEDLDWKHFCVSWPVDILQHACLFFRSFHPISIIDKMFFVL